MSTTTMATPRTWWNQLITSRPWLVVLVGVIAAGLIATFAQGTPGAMAAEQVVKGITVQRAPELVVWQDGACKAAIPVTYIGDKAAVDVLEESVGDEGVKRGIVWRLEKAEDTPGGHAKSVRFEAATTLTEEQCNTATVIDEHRGRAILQMPDWVRGALAAVASLAVFLAVVFVVTGIVAAIAPELAIYGELAGGCLGGFASTFVQNMINGVNQDRNVSGSVVQCIAGAVLNVSLGALKLEYVKVIRKWVGNDATQVVADATTHGGSEVSSEFGSAASQLSEELGALETAPEPAPSPVPVP